MNLGSLLLSARRVPVVGPMIDFFEMAWNGFLSIPYRIWSLVTLLVDLLEEVFRILIGAKPPASIGEQHIGSQAAGEATRQGGGHTDLVTILIRSPIVQNLFQSLIIVAIALIMFFTILQIIREQYKNKDGGDPYKVVFKMFKGMITMLFITAAVIVGLQISGFVLRALDQATGGRDSDRTMSGNIFHAMAHNANRLRLHDDPETAIAEMSHRMRRLTSAQQARGEFNIPRSSDSFQVTNSHDLDRGTHNEIFQDSDLGRTNPLPPIVNQCRPAENLHAPRSCPACLAEIAAEKAMGSNCSSKPGNPCTPNILATNTCIDCGGSIYQGSTGGSGGRASRVVHGFLPIRIDGSVRVVPCANAPMFLRQQYRTRRSGATFIPFIAGEDMSFVDLTWRYGNNVSQWSNPNHQGNLAGWRYIRDPFPNHMPATGANRAYARGMSEQILGSVMQSAAQGAMNALLRPALGAQAAPLMGFMFNTPHDALTFSGQQAKQFGNEVLATLSWMFLLDVINILGQGYDKIVEKINLAPNAYEP